MTRYGSYSLVEMDGVFRLVPIDTVRFLPVMKGVQIESATLKVKRSK